jgi:C1A family cysteine protease
MHHHHREPIPSHHGDGHVHHYKHTDHPFGFHHIHHKRGHKVVVGACKEPKKHHSDKHIETVQKPTSQLPTRVDLRPWLTPVEDQGALGSCTANAIAGAYEYMQKRITGKDGDVSRLFLYYQERKAEGTVAQDAGAALRDGIVSLQETGICSENTWPYQIDTFSEDPSHAAYHEAKHHKIDAAFSIPIDLMSVAGCLASGYPIAFGVKIFESFEDHGNHGRIALPAQGEKCLGGHAMLLVGYDANLKLFLVRNSWGPDWGDAGYCSFPFDYLMNPDYMHDLWTMRVTHDLDFSKDVAQGDVGSAEDWHRKRAQ